MRCKLMCIVYLIFPLMGYAFPSDAELYVLISFSMPDTLIKQYIHESKSYDAKVVIMGLIDNDFVKTQAYISELLKGEKQGGIQIDPKLFTDHGVKTVPAILLSKDDHYDLMYGGVPIRYALEAFQNAGDLKAEAESYLKGER